MNSDKTSSEKTGKTLVKDPVCNMDVNPATAAGSSEYKGLTYHFCSQGCVKRFNADPEKYLTPRTPAAVDGLQSVSWPQRMAISMVWPKSP